MSSVLRCDICGKDIIHGHERCKVIVHSDALIKRGLSLTNKAKIDICSVCMNEFWRSALDRGMVINERLLY